ncbi:hypothetical protein RhiirA4_470135 [Rhizophagus irregularis]|uniref:Uncharacterized protein n=1 Tax=Rhizophagus irregularis TaxID=588596 RepID=A0A2I1H0R5_9GLOM|nr:hypothetical protein RhiirA4_470135 [Rhizophagus irregularis]
MIKRRFLIIDCIKVKSKITDNGKRNFEYIVMWLIRENDYKGEHNNELRFSVKELSDIILGINDNILKLLHDFMGNLSNNYCL